MPAPDLVIGIDSSTTATKAVLFETGGRQLAASRSAHPTARPRPLHAEQEAEDWWNGLCATLGEITAGQQARIAAVAIAHQRESFVLVDGDDRPLRPAILWIDERAGAEVDDLGQRLGRERLRAITGKEPDPMPALYKLAWLHRHEPRMIEQAAWVLDVQGFLVKKLTGEAMTSTASADPLGLLHMETCDWADELALEVGIERRKLAALRRPGERLCSVSAEAGKATGLLPGTPVVGGGGDGQMAGLGLGVLDPATAYVSLGSGAVCGIHSPVYRHSRGFRTLVSPSGEGYIFETCIRTCTQLIEWLLDLFGTGDSERGQRLRTLEEEARAIAAGADGIKLVPYWSGVMSPHWDGHARGTITGLGLDHGPAHLFRAAMEGVALEQALALGSMEEAAGRRVERLVVTGGGANSALWCEILASATGRPVVQTAVEEAGCLGAAIAAAVGAGLFASMEEATWAMVPPPQKRIDPRPEWQDIYQCELETFAAIYPRLSGKRM